ncbi:uncharacterized protein B0T23DRAFT_384680 [Neurospora hispaniola]|uniref:Uncharacterized protein n=1 Tax=Neurospora hispaniola TaxID=588809 RepID=A0AAJ0MPB1_9PEZI|nr:hypothetical protein B0T23DRAFT_384680 [Neurospora hispaniola]
MSATAPKIVTTGYVHEALDRFEEQKIGKIGRNLEILRKEPPVRNINLRKDIGSVNLAVGGNLEAVFVQLNGKQATAECDVCKKSLGPFVGCIQHPSVGDGSCANCLYRRQGVKCTHRVSMDTDSDDLPLMQSRKRQDPNVYPPPCTKKNVKKQRRTIETETAGHTEAEPPIHGPGTALGSAADHWLKSLAFSKYASPAPTQGEKANNDYAPNPGHFENGKYTSSSGLIENNNYTLSQAPVAMRGNDYAPSPTPFKGTMNDILDHDTSKPMLAYLPRNVSPEVLRSIAQYHQDLADDLRMEAKRLEKEMRQEREREREWEVRAARQAQYE